MSRRVNCMMMAMFVALVWNAGLGVPRASAASSVAPILPLASTVDVFAQPTEQLCIRNNVDSWDGQGID